jgi:large subunit ribosomal protein L7/L12
MPAISKDDVKTYLKQAPMLEVAELVKELEAEFGVSAAAMPMMMPGAGAGAGAAAAAPAEVKDTFDVVLSEVGDKKINVIKVVREVTSLGLKEAKDLVEAAPKAVLEKVTKEQADKAKEALEGAGATVSYK